MMEYDRVGIDRLREFELLKLKRLALSQEQARVAEQEERPQRVVQERGPGNRHERRSARHRLQFSGGTCSGGE